MKIKQYTFYFLAIILLSIISLQIDNSLSLFRQWYLLGNSEIHAPFADVFFIHAQLPRLAMTLLIGGSSVLSVV